MKIKAAAKINLFLDVLGTLPDGYHALSMIMQSVSCYDTVTLEKCSGERINVISDNSDVPADKDNIAYKAAQLFFKSAGIKKGKGINISIEKNIPMAAGLAGGSADAAAVLYGLNELYSAGFSQLELCGLGEQIGADVPFSLTGGTAYCTDKGGVIAPLPPIEDCHIVLCKPLQDVSTAGAYKQLDEAEYLRHGDSMSMLYAVKNGDYGMMCKKAYNVFEQVIEVPQRPYIKAVMKENKADIAMMSGSGPTVYGVFREKENALKCAESLIQAQYSPIVCTPCKTSIEIIE